MQSPDASESLPRGFAAVDALSDGDSAVITIRATSAFSACPSCGAISDRVHSRYPRRVADLPIAGQRVALALHARRFCCDAVRSARRIFTGTLRRQHSQALGGGAPLGSIRSLIASRSPWEVDRRRVSRAA